MNETSMGVKYFMKFDVTSGFLFLSLPTEKQVVKLDPTEKPSTLTVVAGTGQTCRGNSKCGDGNLATLAKLSYPKVNAEKMLASNLFIL